MEQQTLDRWWLHSRTAPDMPRTLNDERNPVLYAQEMQEYMNCLVTIRDAAEKRRVDIANTLYALRTGNAKVSAYAWNRGETRPQLFSLAHLLQFMVEMGKVHLRMLALSTHVMKRFKQEKQNVE